MYFYQFWKKYGSNGQTLTPTFNNTVSSTEIKLSLSFPTCSLVLLIFSGLCWCSSLLVILSIVSNKLSRRFMIWSVSVEWWSINRDIFAFINKNYYYFFLKNVRKKFFFNEKKIKEYLYQEFFKKSNNIVWFNFWHSFPQQFFLKMK